MNRRDEIVAQAAVEHLISGLEEMSAVGEWIMEFEGEDYTLSEIRREKGFLKFVTFHDGETLHVQVPLNFDITYKRIE